MKVVTAIAIGQMLFEGKKTDLSSQEVKSIALGLVAEEAVRTNPNFEEKLGSPPFAIKLIRARMAAAGAQVTLGACVALAGLCRTPGEVVLYTAAAFACWKGTNPVTLNDLFLDPLRFGEGIPAEETLRRAWLAQKRTSENGRSDNWLDDARAWPQPMPVS